MQVGTTLSWDTIYEPEKRRVISPVSRVWSVAWGGYVLFDWDTFFAATLAGIGDKDLAYANALEILREETPQGFVPNYARAGNWKSSDRSEPPVGAITVLGLYKKFHDRWFLEDAFEPLLRGIAGGRSIAICTATSHWGSDGDNQPEPSGRRSRGTWQGAIYESGLDNSPMYDGTFYNPQTHLLEYADVGLMSMYIADCDALAEIADALEKAPEAKELRDRSARYRAKLATMWDEKAGHVSEQESAYGRKQHTAFADKLLSHAGARGYYGAGEDDGGEAPAECRKGVLGRVGHSCHRAGRSGIQGSELLAGQNLGSDELSRVSRT
jgi:putative isomerase